MRIVFYQGLLFQASAGNGKGKGEIERSVWAGKARKAVRGLKVGGRPADMSIVGVYGA
jgi:hypothetical protein